MIRKLHVSLNPFHPTMTVLQLSDVDKLFDCSELPVDHYYGFGVRICVIAHFHHLLQSTTLVSEMHIDLTQWSHVLVQSAFRFEKNGNELPTLF